MYKMSAGESEPKFLCDRMVGLLCRYLRFMGYDTTSANDLPPGNPREDTLLLEIAEKEERVILTKDAELARRGGNNAIHILSSDIYGQISELFRAGLIVLDLKLTRCSRCNNLLINGKTPQNINNGKIPEGVNLVYCPVCMRQYWEGSHARNLRKVLDRVRSQIS